MMLRTTLFTLLCFSSHVLWANNLDTQRQMYIRADHALKKNDRMNFERLKSQIPDYPLYPYLVYDDLKHHLQHSKPAGITLQTLEKFEKEHPDFPFHSTLRNLWLGEMAKAKNWPDFIKGYRASKNEGLECQYQYAQYQTTQDPKYLSNAKALWLVGYSQDKACDPLFAAWKKKDGIKTSLITQRIKLALESKNFDFATHLSKQLPSQNRHWVVEWEKVVKNPNLLLEENYLKKLTLSDKNKAEVVTRGLLGLAKRDPEQAVKWWEKHQRDVLLSANQINQVKREIAVVLAQQKSPLALEWLNALPKDTDVTALEWRVRTLLADHDWAKVIPAILALPQSHQDDYIWQYWMARALEAQNDQTGARAIYQKLSQNRNYYGFLASKKLKQPLSLQNEPLEVDASLYSKVFAIPAIKRFEELNLIGKEALARIEWFRAIEKMSNEELLAASKIAQKEGLADIAIFTIAKTAHRNDIALRFPLAHKPEIVNNAKKHELDPAWVFAIARQESAFFTDALSPAGARGLMQLLPSTAKWIAKLYSLPYPSDAALHKPVVNVQLGTAYLNNLKKSMQNNVILATASYNAGPNRIPRWLYNAPIETDIWIENIPYKETREYVKNVVAFTCIYRDRLGLKSNFDFMPERIPAKKS